jgi:hypothetical protein
MSLVSLSLTDLFTDVFGINPDGFNPQFAQQPYPLLYADTNQAPYYAYNGNREMYMPLKLADVWLPFPVLSVSCRKNIVETPMVNRRGTVKELISTEDYRFHIKGLIIGDNNEYPEDQVMQLKQLFEIDTALAVQCAKTDIFLLSANRSSANNTSDANLSGDDFSQNLLDQVVLLEMHFPPLNGIRNVQPYEILLQSDTPFKLIID